MRFELRAFLKFGLFTSALLFSMDLLYGWYLWQKNRSPKLNEAAFVMSDVLPCCPHTADVKIIRKCPNPHCDAKLSRKIIDHIDSAKHLICIAMFFFTMPLIGEALLRARKRGVIVRIILNNSTTDPANKQISQLRHAGISMKITGDAESLMHHKFCIIDVLYDETTLTVNNHPLNGVLITGSLNWTLNGFSFNWENILFTSDDHLKTQYKMAFDYIWSRIK